MNFSLTGNNGKYLLFAVFKEGVLQLATGGIMEND